MSLPDVTLTIEDGALGTVPPSTDNVVLKLGTASAGPTNTIESITSLKQLTDTFGSGPLVEAAALSLATAGGPVLCCRIASTVAAAIVGGAGAVTQTGTGVGYATASGTPLDAYSVEVKIIVGGTNLAADTTTFQYSLDGGNTWSATIALPVSGSYTIPNSGITLAFVNAPPAWAASTAYVLNQRVVNSGNIYKCSTAGTSAASGGPTGTTTGIVDGTAHWDYVSSSTGDSFVAADIYSLSTTAPGYALSDLQTTMGVVLADPHEWDAVHVVGAAATASAAAAMAAALDTQMSTAAQSYRFVFAIIEVPTDTDSNLLTAFANTSSKRVMACAGTCTVVSQITGLEEERSSAWPIAARVAQVPIHEDLGRVRTGAILGVTALQRDEQATPGLEGKFATLRTIIGRAGFYITSGRMLAPTGSDFGLVQNRRVMDKACAVSRNGLISYLNDSLVLQDSTGAHPGAVTENQARSIETDVNGQLSSELSGHVTKSYVLIDRTHDVDTDSTLPATVRVQPLGYARFITEDIGFSAS